MLAKLWPGDHYLRALVGSEEESVTCRCVMMSEAFWFRSKIWEAAADTAWIGMDVVNRTMASLKACSLLGTAAALGALLNSMLTSGLKIPCLTLQTAKGVLNAWSLLSFGELLCYIFLRWLRLMSPIEQLRMTGDSVLHTKSCILCILLEGCHMKTISTCLSTYFLCTGRAG